MKLSYLLNSGKNPKWLYYLQNYFRYFTPAVFCRWCLKGELKKIRTRKDAEEIYRRVNYYNKMTDIQALPNDARPLSQHRHSPHRSVYFFDSFEFTRFFDPKLKWKTCFGDITYVPNCPSIVKSRPIAGNNVNSVVMKLEKNRHFVFMKDKLSFAEKEDKVIFRGKVYLKPHRINFMKKFFGHPKFDIGVVDRVPEVPEWKVPKKTLREHLNYKFIMALEGNDVASNLKWVMASHSIAVMPRPTYETWFMEGTLIPNYHYIEIKPDYSDVEARINYYLQHEDEALEIIRHANEYTQQFRHQRKRERLISFLVLQKYFERTGQLPEHYFPHPQTAVK